MGRKFKSTECTHCNSNNCQNHKELKKRANYYWAKVRECKDLKKKVKDLDRDYRLLMDEFSQIEIKNQALQSPAYDELQEKEKENINLTSENIGLKNRLKQLEKKIKELKKKIPKQWKCLICEKTYESKTWLDKHVIDCATSEVQF